MGIGNILKGKNLDTTSGAAKVTVIGNNSQFTGNITFTGTLKVSGTVKGNIETTEDSEAQFVLDQNGLVEDLRILKEYDPFYSDYEKLIGVLKISGEQLEIYKKLLDLSLNNTYQQYYLQPWIDNLSLLPSTSVSLVPEFAEAFNTQFDLENIRAKNG